MRAPRSLMAQIDPAAQQAAVAGSALQAKYGTPVDRESAYEKLNAKIAAGPAPSADQPTQAAPPKTAAKKKDDDDSALEKVMKSPAFKSFARSTASALGREITRGLFGTRRRR
jgi:hypothetical protein